MKKKKFFISVFLIVIIFAIFPKINFINKRGINIDDELSDIPSDNIGTHGSDRNQSRIDKSIQNKLVVIDAGHGGNDPGTMSGDLFEKDIALDVALKLNSILKDWGISTYMIRDEDVFVDYKERIELANEKSASLFLSIHCDWFKDSSSKGTTTLYYPSRALRAGNLVEITYARIIQSELIKSLKTNDRGIIDRKDLSVLKYANMPSVIVELGFLSNKEDTALLSSRSFRDKAAKALATGIKESLRMID